MGLRAVNESCGDVALAIELGDGVELVLVQEALLKGAVSLSSDPSIAAVDQVLDIRAIRQGHPGQVAQDVVGVPGGFIRLGIGLGLELPVGAVGIGMGSIGYEPVLGVVGAGGLAEGVGLGGAVAVGVIRVAGGGEAVGADLDQAPGGIVVIRPGFGEALDGFGLLGDPAQGVSGVGDLVLVGSADLGGFGFEFAEGSIGAGCCCIS